MSSLSPAGVSPVRVSAGSQGPPKHASLRPISATGASLAVFTATTAGWPICPAAGRSLRLWGRGRPLQAELLPPQQPHYCYVPPSPHVRREGGFGRPPCRVL